MGIFVYKGIRISEYQDAGYQEIRTSEKTNPPLAE